MSIFKETFRPFVFKQLRIREAIVKKGNNLDGRFGKPRIDLETEAGKTEKVDIPAGSFFTNTVVKQCTIRMCSGVDLREDNNITEHSKYENPKDLVNEGLAIRYILEGGVAAKQWDFKNNRNLTAGSEVNYHLIEETLENIMGRPMETLIFAQTEMETLVWFPCQEY